MRCFYGKVSIDFAKWRLQGLVTAKAALENSYPLLKEGYHRGDENEQALLDHLLIDIDFIFRSKYKMTLILDNEVLIRMSIPEQISQASFIHHSLLKTT